jgi:hypothetical protein
MATRAGFAFLFGLAGGLEQTGSQHFQEKMIR